MTNVEGSDTISAHYLCIMQACKTRLRIQFLWLTFVLALFRRPERGLENERLWLRPKYTEHVSVKRCSIKINDHDKTACVCVVLLWRKEKKKKAGVGERQTLPAESQNHDNAACVMLLSFMEKKKEGRSGWGLGEGEEQALPADGQMPWQSSTDHTHQGLW